MASILYLRPNLRPPSSSTSLLRLLLPPSCRTFHASPRPQSFESVLSTTHNVLDLIHNSTGLPWVATLPLSALLMRLTIILPISIYTRRRLQISAELNPLLYAWQHQIRNEVVKKDGGATPGYMERETARKFEIKKKEIYRRWGVQRWKQFIPPMLQIPVWLVLVETIRRMCGARTGLLGMLFPKPTSADASQAVGDGESSIVPNVSDAASAVSSNVGIEPGFAAEGILWFPNLLVPDPYFVCLPILLSGAIILNITTPYQKQAAERSVWKTRLHRALIGCGIAIAPLTAGLPAAVHVYWISSATWGFIQNYLLYRYMPVKEPVKPSKPRILSNAVI